MTVVGEWLKELILVVMLAVFADLLLPTKAMQKYVRVVMGLAIIAVMLQPVTPLLQQNWADKLAEYATQQVFSDTAPDKKPPIPNEASLKQVLQDEQTKQAQNIVANQLTQQLRGQFACTPTEVTVTGMGQGADHTEVHVSLTSADASKASSIQSWIAKELGISAEQVYVGTS